MGYFPMPGPAGAYYPPAAAAAPMYPRGRGGFFPGGKNWAGARPPPPGQPGFSSGLQVRCLREREWGLSLRQGLWPGCGMRQLAWAACSASCLACMLRQAVCSSFDAACWPAVSACALASTPPRCCAHAHGRRCCAGPGAPRLLRPC